MKHTASCEQARRRRAVFEKQFPGFCRACQGRGSFTWTENQSPLGSGLYWLEEITELCDVCAGVGRCPRCGRLQYAHWNERLAVALNGFWHGWWEQANVLLNRRGRRFRIAVDPWSRQNWPEKLVYHASGLIRKMQRWTYDWLRGPDETPFAQAGYACKFCGWQGSADVPPVVECHCGIDPDLDVF